MHPAHMELYIARWGGREEVVNILRWLLFRCSNQSPIPDARNNCGSIPNRIHPFALISFLERSSFVIQQRIMRQVVLRSLYTEAMLDLIPSLSV